PNQFSVRHQSTYIHSHGCRPSPALSALLLCHVLKKRAAFLQSSATPGKLLFSRLSSLLNCRFPIYSPFPSSFSFNEEKWKAVVSKQPLPFVFIVLLSFC